MPASATERTTRILALRAMLGDGRAQAVEQECRTAIADDQTDDDAWFHLGLALERRGNRQEAITAVERSIAVADDAERSGQLARMLLHARREAEALVAASRATTMPAHAALDHDTIGCVLARLGRHDAALAAFAEACRLQPDNPQFHYNRACALHFIGDPAASGAHERVLALDPTFVRSHLALATIDVPADRPARVARIDRLLPDIADVEARLMLHGAAARDLERLGDVDGAFAHLASGKTAWRRRIGHDPARDDAMFDALRDAFDDPTYFTGSGTSDIAPVFVIGMPRSGTTLVERILSRHPALVSAGELQSLPAAARAASSVRATDWWDAATIAGLRDVAPHCVGDRYRTATTDIAAGGRRWIDKLPMNFLYVGHILRALPRAKILCLRRDPMDVVWANYKHLFAARAPAFGYAHDPVDTAHYVARFEQLMAYWHARFPGHIHDVHYEGLVDDLDASVAAMLHYLALPFEADCLRFFDNTSPVATPSASQVRRPLYRSSIGAWRRVARQLGPVHTELLRRGIPVDRDG